MEKKFESSMYNDEMMKSKKYDIERNLRNELNILRIKHNETIKEHHKERDSHIKGQSIMRKTVEKQRKLIDEKNNTINELNIKIENAIESRTDMELGLKSVRIKLDRSDTNYKQLQKEMNALQLKNENAANIHKDEIEKYISALNISKRQQNHLENEYTAMSSKFKQMKTMLQHLADANGQVARVYGALGSRLTEVRAEQAAARASLESSKEEIM